MTHPRGSTFSNASICADGVVLAELYLNTGPASVWRWDLNQRPSSLKPHTTGFKRDPGSVILSHTRYRVNNDPEIGQRAEKYDPELGQSDPVICHVCTKITKFWVTFDPELGPTPMDPFPGYVDRVFLLFFFKACRRSNHWATPACFHRPMPTWYFYIDL